MQGDICHNLSGRWFVGTQGGHRPPPLLSWIQASTECGGTGGFWLELFAKLEIDFVEIKNKPQLIFKNIGKRHNCQRL